MARIIKPKDKLSAIRKELALQKVKGRELSAKLLVANRKLVLQDKEKGKRTTELGIANKLKGKLTAELGVATKEIVFQNAEKEKRAAELIIANYARSLIEASLDPLFTINPAGKITDMNNASLIITGVSRKKLIGSDFFNYFTEPDKARKGYQEVFAKGFVADYPLTMRDYNKTDVLFNGSVYKDEQGKVLGVVVVARDITEQKRIATELIEAKINAELATGIAEEAKSKAENATRVAEEAVKSKQMFLSNMSHEIRTPMNAIIGFTKVVLKTDLSAKQNEYLTAIKVSGDALIVLINDILDLAKVDAGKMTFEKIPFKIASSLSSMLHLFEAKIQEKNLKLVKIYDSKIPEVLVGDSVRLHQIIMNLVSNAVKFTSKGKITVEARLVTVNKERARVEFSVTDTGIGMPENRIEQIFENFQQASSQTARLYGGTGLGLAIVKQLVEAQGGTIQVKSQIDKGSSFRFRLDFQKTKAEAEHETATVKQDTEIKNVKVLVVEDIPINQLLMKTLLDDFGFGCDLAMNGKVAIEKLKKNRYDIILMDLQMPKMSGFQATEYIRNKMKSDIPIIALTADVTTVDLEKCKAVGMNDYLSKPIDEKLLYKKIAGLIKLSKTENIPCINLDYLNRITKSDSRQIMEMISLYLKQTPTLVNAIKKSTVDRNWELLQKSMHKIIPSLFIIGISPDFENMARRIEEYARSRKQLKMIPGMVMQLENVWTQVSKELNIEYARLKNATA